MKSIVTKSLTISLAIAAAIALPTAVQAQADTLSDMAPEDTVSLYCYRIPGYGLRCW
ncbi:MAG: hypothetical protein HC800_23985 [Phormidesmis sp. RL_2_1]|nr:hypothetical protein [Phormidesmis sp. RL_2_1]